MKLTNFVTGVSWIGHMLTYLVVCHPVIIEVTGRSEAFPACQTLMRFLSAMDSPEILCQCTVKPVYSVIW
jgi:hypothetical protein